MSVCRGKFAQVRRCIHRETSVVYAAKAIRKRRRAADATHEIFHEIRVLLLNSQSERIVNLYEVFETPSEYILMLEMAEGGELQRVLDENDSIEEHHCRRLVRQVLEGVQHLHRFNIVHLDIKPQNILLTSAFPSGDIKLCDFGISRVLTKGAELREIVGTPDYVAPEILRYEPISLATDIWSIGVLTYVLLSGHSPFAGDHKQETYCNITNGPLEFPPDLFDSVSEEAKDFIRKLIVRDPKSRFNCQECLKHEWLSSEAIEADVQNSNSINGINGNSVTSLTTITMNGNQMKSGEESDSDKENESNRPMISCGDPIESIGSLVSVVSVVSDAKLRNRYFL